MVQSVIATALLLAIAYLFGSIPCGYLAGRYFKGIDIREYGSGSTGATNVLRTLGKKLALLVLSIDAIKGVLAVNSVNGFYLLFPNDPIPSNWQPWLLSTAAIAAIVGHSRSIWINFKGGKSVATSLGVLLTLEPLVALLTVGFFGVVLAGSRIVSLSSISSAIAAIGLTILFKQPFPYIVFITIAGSYVIFCHRRNIERLLAGREPKIGQKLQEEIN